MKLAEVFISAPLPRDTTLLTDFSLLLLAKLERNAQDINVSLPVKKKKKPPAAQQTYSAFSMGISSQARSTASVVLVAAQQYAQAEAEMHDSEKHTLPKVSTFSKEKIILCTDADFERWFENIRNEQP